MEIVQDHEPQRVAPQEPLREAMSPLQLGASIGRSQAFGMSFRVPDFACHALL